MRDLDKYNESEINDTAFESHIQSQRDRLGLGSAPVAPDDALGQACEQTAAWLVPFLVRADLLALRMQRRFRFLSTAMSTMAAMAVTIVAYQTNQDLIVGFEVLLLLLLLGIPLLRNRLRLHERWTSYRFLAERLRSA
jgi:hypothetical protein